MKSQEIINPKFLARAVFLTGVTDYGNELLRFHPNIKLSEKIKHDLCLKSMPMACEDDEMLITHISDYQAICLTKLIPCFEKNSFRETTHATLGLLIPRGINPIPYYQFIEKLMKDLKDKGDLNKETLERMVPIIYAKLNQNFNNGSF